MKIEEIEALVAHAKANDKHLGANPALIEKLLAVAKAAKKRIPHPIDHDHASDCGCALCELINALADLERE